MPFRTPTAWERNAGEILAALGVILVESVLIGLLLLERRKRLRAQQVVADQAKHERMISELMTDAARHAPQNAPRALEDAIARLGQYLDAEEVVLVQYPSGVARPARRLRWTRHDPGGRSQSESGAVDGSAPRIEVPLVAAGTTVGRLEVTRTSGAEHWMPPLAEQLPAAADVIAGAIARSCAAREAEEAQRTVAHMGRIAMIGELASTISHELRQPLAAIRINAHIGQLLLKHAPPDATEVIQVLEDIIRDNDRASEVIEHIRGLLRKEPPTASEVSLNAVCGQAAALLHRDAYSRGIRLDLSFDPRVPPITGYPIELQQVALNLLLNALDAASTSVGDRWVSLSTTMQGESVEIVVRDSGPGLSRESSEHLFESFFSTKVHGLGIGLVIVRSIVDRHGGRIQAENGEAGGAIFRVRLPVGDRPGVIAGEAPAELSVSRAAALAV